MGFDAVDAQGLTAPPFFLSFLITIFSTWVADKTQQRGWTIMLLATIGGTGMSYFQGLPIQVLSRVLRDTLKLSLQERSQNANP